jgi:FkbM family methyltransferase
VLPSSIRKLSYNPVLRRIARSLHMSAGARHLYCKFLSGTGELDISCCGVDAVFRCDTPERMAFVDCIFTTERDALEATLSQLRPGDTFLDVGCHCGIYSILASKIVGPTGKVISVEPHPGTLDWFKRNVQANRCSNITALNLALGDAPGRLALTFSDNGAHKQRGTDAETQVHMVDAAAGDDVVSGMVNVIKIDVEGHEFAVLKGLHRTLSNSGCRVLCLEIHPPFLPSGVDTRSILSFIEQRGLGIASMISRPPETHVIATRS